MQIAAAPPQTDIVTVRPGPADSQRAYTPLHMLLRLPGAESVSYRAPGREWYKVQQVNPAFAKLADAILKDVIDGSRILFEPQGELPQPPDAGYGDEPWWERRIHMVKAISNLPGVHDYQWVGSRGVAIHAANEQAREGLLNVLVDTLPDKNRTKVFVVVSKNGPEG